MMEDEAPELRKHLCHSKKMQESVYENSQRNAKAARISNIIQKVMNAEVIDDADFARAEAEIQGLDMEEARERLPPPKTATATTVINVNIDSRKSLLTAVMARKCSHW
jgi:hypothetical protein